MSANGAIFNYRSEEITMELLTAYFCLTTVVASIAVVSAATINGAATMYTDHFVK